MADHLALPVAERSRLDLFGMLHLKLLEKNAFGIVLKDIAALSLHKDCEEKEDSEILL